MTVSPTRMVAGVVDDSPSAMAAACVADVRGLLRESRRPISRAMPPVPSLSVMPVAPLAVALSTSRPAVPPSLTMVALTPVGDTPVFASFSFPCRSTSVSVAAIAIVAPLIVKLPVSPSAAPVSAADFPANRAVSASCTTSTRYVPGTAVSEGTAVSRARLVVGLVGTVAVYPPKPVRRIARAASFSVTDSVFSCVQASFCLARSSSSLVIGVTSRACCALIAESTMSPH